MGAMHVLTLDLAPVTPSDAPLLHRVFHLSPSYFALIGMELPTLEDVVRDLQTLEVDPRRRAFLLFLGQEPVGYLDAKLGYPEAEDATLSLLLIREDHQGRGLGRQALERFAAGLDGVRRLYAVVYGHNPKAKAFFQAQGFRYVKDGGPTLTWYVRPL